MFIEAIDLLRLRVAAQLGLAALAGGCYVGVDAGLDGPSSMSATGSTTDASTGGPGTDTAEGSGESGQPAVQCPEQGQRLLELVNTNCVGCHNPDYTGDNGGLENLTDLGRLVTSGLVEPGEPFGSELFVRVGGGTMPPSGPLPQEDVDLVSDWITSCATAPDEICDDNERLDIADMLRVMKLDVLDEDTSDQPFFRYFTLYHLHNAGLCEPEVELHRQAVAKLVNSLSSEASLDAPVSIDERGLILRIDLRDYGWDEAIGGFANKWDLLVDASPYAFEREEDDANQLEQFTQSAIPFLQADAFIEIASVADDGKGVGVYNELAAIPASVADLEAELGVNIDEDVAAGDQEIARAGLGESGVDNHVRQNLIVERHNGVQTGPFWIAYLFDASLGEQNIFESPLDFVPRGGLGIIYSLPNGLSAYLLADENRIGIDIASDQVLGDPSQDDGNVHNGVSCFGCHVGILEATDEIREYALEGAGSLILSVPEKEEIEEIYVPHAELQSLVDDDNGTLLGRLETAGVDPSADLEPISEAALRFDFNVGLERAAAELGIAPATLLSNIGALSPSLSTLASGQVKRETWTALFANTVCVLNLGIANDPVCTDA